MNTLNKYETPQTKTELDPSVISLQIKEHARAAIENWDEIESRVAPVIEFACKAHDGINGLDGRPLVLHSADVMTSPLLNTLEQRQLGILHDAATPGYSALTQEEFVEQARETGCSEKVIAAALCFARPAQGWTYDDWVSFLMRDDLTRLTKAADSAAAIKDFPPASENQLNAWKRTEARLLANESEPTDVTARIAASMQAHPLPDIRNDMLGHRAA